MHPVPVEPESTRGVSGIERLTAVTLIAVVAMLGWMTAAALIPQWSGIQPSPWQVIAVLGLLFAGLFLVSLVALLHTRR